MAENENMDWFDGEKIQDDVTGKLSSNLKRKKSTDSIPDSKTGRFDDSAEHSVENDTSENVNSASLDASFRSTENDNNSSVSEVIDSRKEGEGGDDVERGHRQRPGSVTMRGMKSLSQYGSLAQDEYLNIHNDSNNEWSKQPHQIKKDRRQFQKHSTVQPDPETAEYPVILEDIGDSQKGHKKFKDYGKFTENLFRDSGLAPIRRQRRLVSGKWLIHCNSAISQSKLAARSCLGKNDEVKVKCFIPTHRTIGVIRSVPLSITTEQIVNGNKDIISASRLLLREGGESRAIKVFFSCQVLPSEIRLGNELVSVTPFVEPVIRCTKCQKFNHGKTKCTAKFATCPNCGNKAHSHDSKMNRDLCPATVSYCINCQSTGHSAAWGGCPKLKLMQKAHAESSRLGVPVGIVLQKLKGNESIPSGMATERSFYFRDGPSKPPTPSFPNTSVFSFSDMVKGNNHNAKNIQINDNVRDTSKTTVMQPKPQIGNMNTETNMSEHSLAPPSSPPASSALHVVRGEGGRDDGYRESQHHSSSQSQASMSTPSCPQTLLPLRGETSTRENDMLEKLDIMMRGMEERFTKALSEQSEHFQNKLNELEKGDKLAEAIVSKISEKRQQEIEILRVKATNMKSTNPIKLLLGNLMSEVMQAAELGKPERLISMVTQLYEAGGGEKVSTPVWDSELQDIASLVAGSSKHAN